MVKKWAWMTALLAGLLLLTGCGADALPQEEIPVEGDPLMRDTLVYYEQGDGLLVPVVVQEEWSETMLTSLAERLVANELEQLDLEEAGLTALLPGDTRVNVTLEDGTATVNMQSSWLGEVSAKRGKNIAASMVNTLCQFPAVQQVQLQVNGKSEKLGETDISKPLTEMDLNPEGKAGKNTPVTVYYKTADTGLLVPVTKYVKNVEAETVVETMLGTPATDNVMSLFPWGTRILDVSLGEDGVLSLNFSKEFLELRENPYLENIVMKNIPITCKQVDGVKDVRVYVEGEEYQPLSKTTMSVFGNELGRTGMAEDE